MNRSHEYERSVQFKIMQYKLLDPSGWKRIFNQMKTQEVQLPFVNIG